MKRKPAPKEKIALLFILTLCIYACKTSPVSAQDKIQKDFDSCDFLATIAVPQIMFKQFISSGQRNLMLILGKNEGAIRDDGKVIDRVFFSDLTFTALERTEVAVSFGSVPASVPAEQAQSYGYILEILDVSSNKSHFAAAGLNKSPVYNPCNVNVNGPIQSSTEIFVFARSWLTK